MSAPTPFNLVLSEADYQRWSRLRPFPGEAWEFWKGIFDKTQRLITMGADMIPHIRHVKDAEFRVEFSSRKLPPRAIKMAKDMEAWGR